MLGNPANAGEVKDPTLCPFFKGTQLSDFEFTSRAMCTIVEHMKKLEDIGDIFINKIYCFIARNSRVAQNIAYLPAPCRMSLVSLIAFRETRKNPIVRSKVIKNLYKDLSSAGAKVA
jgi:hypothetical protein